MARFSTAFNGRFTLSARISQRISQRGRVAVACCQRTLRLFKDHPFGKGKPEPILSERVVRISFQNGVLRKRMGLMIIVARRFGQLDNRLILASHLMAAAREYGLEFANPSFVKYAHLFPSTARYLWCRFPQDTSLSHEPTRRRRELTAKTVYGVAKGL